MPDDLAQIYQAATLGLRDYVNKNGFRVFCWGCRVALIVPFAQRWRSMRWAQTMFMPLCCHRATPVGRALTMPRPAGALGIRLDTVPIAPPVEAVEAVLSDMFVGTGADITEENIQCAARHA